MSPWAGGSRAARDAARALAAGTGAWGVVAVAASVALGGLAGWSSGSRAFPATAAVLVAGFALFLAWRATLDGTRPPLALPFPWALAALWAAAIVSVAASDTARVDTLLAFVAAGLIAVAACDIASGRGGETVALAAGAVALGAGSAVALAAWLSGWKPLVPLTPDAAGRLAWPFSHPNFLGFFCAALLPVAVAGAIAAGRRAVRIAALAAVALGTGALLASASRSAWIATAVGLAVVAAYGPARRVIAVGLVTVAAVSSPLIFDRAADADAGLENVRVDIWASAGRAFLDHPLTGVGLRSLREHVDPVLGDVPLLPAHAHHLFLGRAAELGILGLLGIVGLMGLALLSAHRGARGRAGAGRVLAIGLVGALAAVTAFGLLDDPFFDRASQALVWALVGTAAAVGRQAEGIVTEPGPTRATRGTGDSPPA
jgi:O-antigen ligase